MGKPRQATSHRLTEEAQGLLRQLADVMGLPSKTAVLELAIRRLAKAELPANGQPADESPPPAKRGRPPKKEGA